LSRRRRCQTCSFQGDADVSLVLFFISRPSEEESSGPKQNLLKILTTFSHHLFGVAAAALSSSSLGLGQVFVLFTSPTLDIRHNIIAVKDPSTSTSNHCHNCNDQDDNGKLCSIA
jgi:hypothetical protein